MSNNPEQHAVQKTRLERLAAHQSNYWIGFASDPATAVFFVVWDVSLLHAVPGWLVLSYFAGIFNWTLFEYVFHRWIYHRGETLAHAGHRMHHDHPKMLIGMPWFMTTGFLWLLWYVFAYKLEIRYFVTFWAGMVTGYLVYSALHHVHHHFSLRGPWIRKLYAHHQIHHKFENVNFGVTNRFWDHVFGTTYRKQSSVIPAKVSSSSNYLGFIWRLASAAHERWR
ncbi:MAG TPA: sterol desaturase family protein [Pyrinomonadaceae bacterium]|nr:sterol desaturase family protein [Pyrinomonadaceae bacterium]